jgi:hypothetical protein
VSLSWLQIKKAPVCKWLNFRAHHLSKCGHSNNVELELVVRIWSVRKFTASFLNISFPVFIYRTTRKLLRGFRKLSVLFTYRRRTTEMKVNSNSFPLAVLSWSGRCLAVLLKKTHTHTHTHSDPRFWVRRSWHPSAHTHTPCVLHNPPRKGHWRQIWRSQKPSDWNFHSSRLSRSVNWVTDVSGQPIGSILKAYRDDSWIWYPIGCPETSITTILRCVYPRRAKMSFLSRWKTEIKHVIELSLPPLATLACCRSGLEDECRTVEKDSAIMTAFEAL